MKTQHQSVLDQLDKSKVKPEPGERRLVELLCSALSDDYQIYFQPFLNGDRPDVVVVLEGHGAIIFEVKDWNLSNYCLDDRKHWFVMVNGRKQPIKSPIQQVLQYKENIYDLHVPLYLELKLREPKFWAAISCAVYFHGARQQEVRDLIETPFVHDEKYCRFLSHIDLLANDTLTARSINELVRRHYMHPDCHRSRLFPSNVYKNLMRYLEPPLHTIEEGSTIPYTADQRKLIESFTGAKKFKGVVGSGKTCVLAARAVAAHRRTQKSVLVLTFNITLRNYIHDAIGKVKEPFSWAVFHITNYHHFITSELNNVGIRIVVPEDFDGWSEDAQGEYFEKEYYSNLDLFREHQQALTRYGAILIDETQDYKYEWMEILRTFFLEDGGEYVLVGDEKQNIYDTELEERNIRTNIPGRWDEKLKVVFRANKELAQRVLEFQRILLAQKYDVDNDMLVSRNRELGLWRIEYQKFAGDEGLPAVYQSARAFCEAAGSHPNDTAVLGFTIATLRNLDCCYRWLSNEKTTTMFEPEEIRRMVLLRSCEDASVMKDGLNMLSGARIGDDNGKWNRLVDLWILRDLITQTKSEALQTRLANLLDNIRLSSVELEGWLRRADAVLGARIGSRARSDIRKVRESRKFHFWGNAGTVKLSTVHSFKGWEAETVVVIVEPKYERGEFQCSFEELIYTAFTRAKSNLLVLNYGNTDFESELRAVFGKTKNFGAGAEVPA